MGLFSILKGKKNVLSIASPMSGRVLLVSDVPDPTFAQKILGDGFAIEPTEGKVVAPVDATVVNVFKTGHAVGLETENGIEILIHVGIDTVKMKGEGFEALVQTGQKVRRGQELIRFNLALVRDKAPSTISPIVITNMDKIAHMHRNSLTEARAGDEVLSLELNG